MHQNLKYIDNNYAISNHMSCIRIFRMSPWSESDFNNLGWISQYFFFHFMSVGVWIINIFCHFNIILLDFLSLFENPLYQGYAYIPLSSLYSIFTQRFSLYNTIFRILICHMNLLEAFQQHIFLEELRLFTTLIQILTAQKSFLKIMVES